VGFNINKIDGVSGVYKNQKVESRKNIPESARTRGKKDEVQISKEAMDFRLVMKAAKAAREIPDIREEVIARGKASLRLFHSAEIFAQVPHQIINHHSICNSHTITPLSSYQS
jgi:hypothetical protein